ncbi:MAG: DHA2 family efflux MFS transporter permease subunit [Rhodospirillaceae bacterium]|nr:DHA2 family efflux MFS transporter permease subunit [Rhodospirillaceae bacterium]MBT5810639.1 DHA2 family efflux MFS transporter permease subunit [Rhodospirillaceae bacterium]
MYAESIDTLFERYGPVYKWLAAATCMLGGMTAILASSTVNVAFPDIMGTFGIGRDQAQLLSTGFFASMTAGMLLSAWLIDWLGERLSYSVALVLFLLGAAMSGTAQNPEILMSGRVLQGTAAGIIQPLTMAVVFKVFPKGRKGMSMGIYSMGMVLAPTLGPTAGGFAIEYFNWRYAFLLTLPSISLAFILGNLFMPSRVWSKTIPPFDFLGFGFLAGGLFCYMIGFSYGQRLGWGSNDIVELFAAAVILTICFILRQLYGPNPLINLKLFMIPQFTAAALIALLTGCAFLASTFMLPLFVQQIQQYSPMEAGMMMIPGGLSLLIMFPVAGRLADALPPQVLIYAGLISFSLAFVFLARADVNTPFWSLVSFTLLIRAGTAFTRPVINSTALQAVPQALVNQGSGAINFMRQLGAAMGTSLLVVFLERRIPFHSDAFAAAQTGAGGFSLATQGQLTQILGEAGVPEALREPGALHHFSSMIYAQASTNGFQDTFLALAFVSIVGVIPAGVMALMKHRPAPPISLSVAK